MNCHVYSCVMIMQVILIGIVSDMCWVNDVVMTLTGIVSDMY